MLLKTKQVVHVLILAHRTAAGTVDRLLKTLTKLPTKVEGFDWSDGSGVVVEYFANGKYAGEDWEEGLEALVGEWQNSQRDVSLLTHGHPAHPTSTVREIDAFLQQHEGDIDLPGVVLVVATHPRHMEQAKAVMPPELRENAVLIPVDHVDWTWRDTAIVRIAVLLKKMGLSEYVAKLNRILGRA